MLSRSSSLQAYLNVALCPNREQECRLYILHLSHLLANSLVPLVSLPVSCVLKCDGDDLCPLCVTAALMWVGHRVFSILRQLMVPKEYEGSFKLLVE